jgi:hypothetical protein
MTNLSGLRLQIEAMHGMWETCAQPASRTGEVRDAVADIS